MYEVNVEIAQKVIDAVKPGLVKGLGEQIPGQMCVEAAVCFAYGLPHSDEPPCVGFHVRSLKIRLNDSNWESNQSRAKGMLRLSVAQLGSDQIDQDEFRKIVQKMTIQKFLPLILRKAGMNEAADRCEAEGTVTSAKAAHVVAYNAAYYASSAAYYAADAAAKYASSAADAADAAYYAADAVRYIASVLGEQIFHNFAEEVVQILIQMKSPGCEYLYLTE